MYPHRFVTLGGQRCNRLEVWVVRGGCIRGLRKSTVTRTLYCPTISSSACEGSLCYASFGYRPEVENIFFINSTSTAIKITRNSYFKGIFVADVHTSPWTGQNTTHRYFVFSKKCFKHINCKFDRSSGRHSALQAA